MYVRYFKFLIPITITIRICYAQIIHDNIIDINSSVEINEYLSNEHNRLGSN